MTHQSPGPTLLLNKNRVTQLLLLCVSALIGTHIGLQYIEYRIADVHWLVLQMFDVDVEDSVPTWYSSSALLFSAALAYLKYIQVKASPGRYYWLIMAAGLAFLSLDEIAGFHEALNTLTEVSWAVPALGVVAVAGVLYLRFLLSLPRRTMLLLVMAGGIFLAGAVGVELATESYADDDLLNTLAYNLWTAVEEGLEMLGVVVLVYGLLDSLQGEMELKIE